MGAADRSFVSSREFREYHGYQSLSAFAGASALGLATLAFIAALQRNGHFAIAVVGYLAAAAVATTVWFLVRGSRIEYRRATAAFGAVLLAAMAAATLNALVEPSFPALALLSLLVVLSAVFVSEPAWFYPLEGFGSSALVITSIANGHVAEPYHEIAVLLFAIFGAAAMFRERSMRLGRSYKSHLEELERDKQLETMSIEREHAHRLQRRNAFEDLILELATRLLDSGSERVDDEIRYALSRIGEFAGMDRTYVFLYNEDGTRMSNSYEWVRDGVTSEMDNLQDLPADMFPWWDAKMRAREIVDVPFVAELSDEAATERAALAEQAIQSLLAIPMEYNDALRGFLGMETVQSTRSWDDDSKQLLLIAGRMLASAIARREREIQLRETATNFRQLAEGVREVFFLAKPDFSEMIYVSPLYETVWERSVQSLYGNPGSWLEAIVSDDRERVTDSYRRLIEDGGSFSEDYRIVRPSGELRWIRARTFPVLGPNGEVHRHAGLAEDITKQREAQERLKSAQERETEVAAEIQEKLLLETHVHDIPGLEFAANAVPSRTIDGDFYNLYYLKPDSVDLLVGDVMGKGIPAALVGAATRAKFAQATLELFQRHPRQEPEPREIVAAAHDHMVDELIQLETFATLHYVRCDVAEGRLDYVDCGNTPLLHYRRRSGATWVLKGRNVPLGFSKDEQYEQFTVPVHEGDILLSFSDGITEATNDAGEAFGEKRLIGLIDANPGLTSGQLVDTISRELETFTGGKRFKDDVTLVALRIGEKAERCRTSSEQHRFEPRLEQSRTVRETVLDFLSKLPQALSERDTQAIALATNEAFTNICRHSQTVDRAPVELELTSMRSWLSIRFEYTDDNFRWTGIPDPDFASLDEGGYGVYLMREVADSVTYSESSDGRMSVCLSKKLS